MVVTMTRTTLKITVATAMKPENSLLCYEDDDIEDFVISIVIAELN